MKRILLLIASLWTADMASLAQSPTTAKGHDAFIDGLREIVGNASQKGFGGKSASKPRTLSRWFLVSKDGSLMSRKKPNRVS